MVTQRFENSFRSRLIPLPVSVEFPEMEYFPMKKDAVLRLVVDAQLYTKVSDLVQTLTMAYWKWEPVLQNIEPDSQERVPAEGYSINVNQDAIVLKASDRQGIRNALSTLRQLSESERHVKEFTHYIVPYCKIEDFPAMSFRGMHLCWFPETSVTDIEKQIRLAAYYKFNYIVLEPWGVFPFECEPDFGWKDKMFSRQDWQHIIDVAGDLEITLIPQLNIFGHAAAARVSSGKHAILNFSPKYASLFEEDGWCWCLSNPETRKLLKNLCLELHEFFGCPPFFHIGCDEAYTAASCSECLKHELVDLLKDHLLFFQQLFAGRNTRLMLWHDMFLDHDDPRFGSGYVASGSKAKGLSRLIGELPRDMVFCDWQYCGCTPAQPLDFEWASSKFFMDAGYDTLLCPWENLQNNLGQGNFIARHHGLGILGTTWHVNKGSWNLSVMFAGTAQGAWNPAAIRSMSDYLVNACTFGASVRAVERDMKLNRYEDFGFLNQYQIDVSKSLQH